MGPAFGVDLVVGGCPDCGACDGSGNGGVGVEFIVVGRVLA